MNRFPTRQRSGRPAWLGGRRNPLPQYGARLRFRPAALPIPGDVLVCVFLRGGMDGLSAIAPYGEGASYYDVRPTISLPAPGAGPGTLVDLDGFFGMNPAMAPLKPFYDAGTFLPVHATGGVDPTRSHFDAQRFMEQGVPGDVTVQTGWLGRHLHATAPQDPSLFRAVAISDLVQTSLRGPEPALAVPDLDGGGLSKVGLPARQMLAALYGGLDPSDLLYQQGGWVFQTIDTLDALSQTPYQPANGAVYPDRDGFGVSMRQVAQLIKAGIGLEVACVDLGGWDTHQDEGTRDGGYADVANVLAAGMAAFATDLGDAMNGVTVVTMSEFGRRVEENASHGTDHGHGNIMLLLGGGVAGGRVLSDWPGLSPDHLDDGDLAITIDARDILAEIVQKRLLDTNLDYVFPGYAPTFRGAVRSR